jgi:two-component system, NarL family, nitrate/nitrite response regulator NarL
LLNTRKHLKIIAEATSAENILQLIRINEPDILITDIMMPVMTGFDLTLQLKKEKPHIKILALSMSEDGGMIARMIEDANVDGYIPKAAGKQELINAIETIVAGNTCYSRQVMEQYNTYKALQSDNQSFNLTARELQVIECIIQHFNNRQIANALFISERTVETHRKNIYRKTNTRGEASLVQFVKTHKLLP